MSFFCRSIETPDMLREPATRKIAAGCPKELLAKAFDRQRAGRPQLCPLPAADLPQPYRSLLVHNSDMTSTLKHYHQDDLSLRVLHREVSPSELRREVLLCRCADGKPVEYGVIRIALPAFAPSAREAILKGVVPLGQILDTFGIRHWSRPNEYFRIDGNEYLRRRLDDRSTAERFGRVNTLSRPAGGALAEVVEILPTTECGSAGASGRLRHEGR